MLQYYLQQLGAAREGDGEGLAVSDVDESDADARGWKTCRMNQMLTKRLTPVAKNLQSWMSVETAADARGNEFPLHRLACINA